MGNTLKMEKREILKQLFGHGWSDRKINIATGINRRTISKYRCIWEAGEESNRSRAKKERKAQGLSNGDINFSQNAPLLAMDKCPPGQVVHFEVPTDSLSSTGKQSKSRVSIYDARIRKKLGLGQNARSIYQDLYVEVGYRGSYDSVKRYVRRLKQTEPKLYARLETMPGEEAQVDFGQGAATLKKGRYYRPWLFVMTLSYSRKSYEEVVWNQDVETFIRCHEHAFRHFGGIPEVIKHDNLKSAILKAHLYEPELNPNYQAFSQHYGFVPLPCKVATPEHKGKVEAGVKYVQNNALKGKRFESVEKQNHYLRYWNKTWASTRIHGTTKRQVARMFSEEQPALKPLPQKAFVFFKIGTRKVNSLDSHIEVGGAYYPVPPKYLGKRVTVHYNQEWVKVYYQGHLIQWLTTVDKGRFHPDKSCLPENKTLTRNIWQQRLLQQCSRRGPALRQWADQALAARGLTAYRAIQGVLALGKKYPMMVVEQACSLALERQSWSYHLVRHYAEEQALRKTDQSQLTLAQDRDIIRAPQTYADLMEGRAKP